MKQDKNTVSAFRTFQKKCLQWSLFLRKLQATTCSLHKNKLHCIHLQGVLQNFWNKNKKLSLTFTRKIYTGDFNSGKLCTVSLQFFLKRILLLSFLWVGTKFSVSPFQEKKSITKLTNIQKKSQINGLLITQYSFSIFGIWIHSMQGWTNSYSPHRNWSFYFCLPVWVKVLI